MTSHLIQELIARIKCPAVAYLKRTYWEDICAGRYNQSILNVRDMKTSTIRNLDMHRSKLRKYFTGDDDVTNLNIWDIVTGLP